MGLLTLQGNNQSQLQPENLFYIHDTHPKSRTQPKAFLKQFSQFAPEPHYNNSESKDDLYKCIRILLCFGRILGIVPLSGLFNGNLAVVTFQKRSLAGVTSLVIIIILIGNNAIALLSFFGTPSRDANNISQNISGFFCYSIGLFIFVFMYKNSNNLIDIFHKWRSVKTVFYQEDTKLFRSITFISGFIFTSAILENLVSHWKYLRPAIFPSSVAHNATHHHSSIWEIYYEDAHSQYVRFVPYNLILSIIFFLCNKWSVYAWNFGDILISVLARAIHKRFYFQLKSFKKKLENDDFAKLDETIWVQAVKDHEKLVNLMNQVGKLISPLIFACIFTNIFFICLILNYFLVPTDADVVNSVYVAWAFVHLIVRTFTTIVSCAKVNEHAHKIDNVLQKCPTSVLSKHVERTELKLRTTCLGFTGMDCFTITKPFILSVFSVIFTFEIVLLQSTVVPSSPAPTQEPIK